jgi:hypothetical protein
VVPTGPPSVIESGDVLAINVLAINVLAINVLAINVLALEILAFGLFGMRTFVRSVNLSNTRG